jgi:hypothetical protein
MTQDTAAMSAPSAGSAVDSGLICEGCGCQFSKKPGETRNRRFCTRQCYQRFAKREHHACYQKDAQSRVCVGCQTLFRVTKSELGRKFCEIECWRRFQREHPANGLADCKECGKTFKRLKAGQLFCCDSCRLAHCHDEQSPSWKGGVYLGSEGFVVCRTDQKRESGSNAGRAVYTRRHRLIVEAAIGRKLDTQEKIWHIDGDKSNDKVENLYIFRSQAEMASAIGRGDFPSVSNIVQACEC